MSNSSDSKISCDAGEHPVHHHTLHSEAVLSKTAVLFHALGDTERLRLMELLFDGPHCVSELAAETGQSMSMISQSERLTIGTVVPWVDGIISSSFFPVKISVAVKLHLA